MNTISISRNYLESLKTKELVSLANDFDITIPDNLNKQFIIGEILSYLEEGKESFNSDGVAYENAAMRPCDELPFSYNETKIEALVRNPAWVFVYWDISETDLQESCRQKLFTSFVLHINFYDNAQARTVIESYDIHITETDRKRYIFLPHHKYAFKIELYAEFKTLEARKLAQSTLYTLPKGYPILSTADTEGDCSPLLALSGFAAIRRIHFANHRQSFA